MTSHLPRHPLVLAALIATLAMLGPFSIDTYLPAFPEMALGLNTGLLQIQQTLTVYLVAWAVMTLWHGSISDAVGRRPVILAALGVYALASLGCAIAGNVQTLLLFRVMQGMSAGAGLVVGRAIIRDRFHGPEAQRLMSQVTLMFGVAPAVAPVVGGLLSDWLGWRAIFAFLMVFALGLLAWCIRALPETHPPSLRQPLQAKLLLRNYARVATHREFQLLAGVIAFNFAGFFLYIPAAPVFLMEHLGVSARGFAWLFLPSILGIMAGAWLSGRLAGRRRVHETVRLGYVLLFGAALGNLVISLAMTPRVPWSILPLPLYTCGMSLVMPSITLVLLDLFPSLKGMTSSLQGFTQTLLSSIVAGVFAPALAISVKLLAVGMLVFLVLGFACWRRFHRMLPAAGEHGR